MFIKEITYTDFLGTERKETHYFNLTKPELMRMNMLEDGKMGNVLQEIVNAKNSKEMWSRFETLLQASYGRLSNDGRRHEKSPEIIKEFMETEAYTALIDWFLEDQKNIEEFVNEVIPSDVRNNENKPQLEVVDNHKSDSPIQKAPGSAVIPDGRR